MKRNRTETRSSLRKDYTERPSLDVCGVARTQPVVPPLCAGVLGDEPDDDRKLRSERELSAPRVGPWLGLVQTGFGTCGLAQTEAVLFPLLSAGFEDSCCAHGVGASGAVGSSAGGSAATDRGVARGPVGVADPRSLGDSLAESACCGLPVLVWE
jgi:hypothetical protein